MRKAEIKSVLIPAGKKQMTEAHAQRAFHQIGDIPEGMDNAAALILEIVRRHEAGAFFKPGGAHGSGNPAGERAEPRAVIVRRPVPVSLMEGQDAFVALPEAVPDAGTVSAWLDGLKGKTVAVRADERLETLAVDEGGRITVLRRETLADAWEAGLNALFSGSVSILTHGAKELQRRLLERGLACEGIAFDTELAAYLLDSARGRYELAQLAVEYLHTQLPEAKALGAGGMPADRAAIAAKMDELAAGRVALAAHYLRDAEATYAARPGPETLEKWRIASARHIFEKSIPRCMGGEKWDLN